MVRQRHDVRSVTQIAITYAGQYSKASVSQQIYLYNFTTNSWDLFDTRSVGNESDVKVTAMVSTNPQRYVSLQSQIRARVRGVRAGAKSTTAWKFDCWANCWVGFEVNSNGSSRMDDSNAPYVLISFHRSWRRGRHSPAADSYIGRPAMPSAAGVGSLGRCA